MESIKIYFSGEEPFLGPELQPQGWGGLTIQVQTTCSYLHGSSQKLSYSTVQQKPEGGFLCRCEWACGNQAFTQLDHWFPVSVDKVCLERRLQVSASSDATFSAPSEGFQLHLGLEVNSPSSDWQFFAPGMLYSPRQFAGEKLVVFSDQRLAFPMIMAYQRSTGRVICVMRAKTARFDNRPMRTEKEQKYLQETDVGAVGFEKEHKMTALHLFWPYFEGEKSALLNARGSSASAYYPVCDLMEVSLKYEIYICKAENFASAVFEAFKNALSLEKPQPVRLPFSLEDSIDYRLDSLQKTYSEWPEGITGFAVNFDPERGYDSQAKAFGASFTVHETNRSHDILEYGFTGRQLNAAYMLAEERDEEWVGRGRGVVNFFVDRLVTDSGWMYTLYDVGRKGPLYTIGDPQGPVMHYLASASQGGNYTRMMVEAAWDLLLNYRLHSRLGMAHEPWLQACVRFADFLLRCQSSDGSWYRAYTPSGGPVLSSAWFGTEEGDAKTASSVPIPFLLALAEELDPPGQHYIAAAVQAGHYILREQVAFDEYRGGTLDNPNVVDKEAAMLTMMALLHLFEHNGDDAFLCGAERAGKLAVTWNLVWNIPLIPGTRVAAGSVQSTGWGGINSIWGGGVTDIYSLFFLAEFVRLSRLTKEPLYARVAELVAHGTQQMLAYPGGLYGFKDVGMQPEGIAFCDQGADESLIAKGDVWGGLGWIYTAGTYGLRRYIGERNRMPYD